MKYRLLLLLSFVSLRCYADEMIAAEDLRLTPLSVLVVDKNTLHARLETLPELDAEPVELGRFKIAIGKELGDKQKEGDNKTPEGVYFTRKAIDGRNLPAKYGSQAIPINFPNTIDKLEGKTGHGIWLHGVEKNSRIDEANVTEGCVAFFNEDIAALANWLKPNRAVVVIAEDAEQVNTAEDREDILKRTLDWVSAWQSRQVDQYIAHYHKDFEHKKGDLEAYGKYKRNVFKGYKSMKVSMSQVRVLVHPKYAISLMNQDFNGDNRYTSKGRKILYWQKDQDDSWKIVRETFSTLLFDEVPLTTADYTQLVTMRKSDPKKAQKKVN